MLKKKIQDGNSVGSVSLLRQKYIPKLQTEIVEPIKTFSLKEKIAFYGIAAIFAVSSLVLLSNISALFSVEIPSSGGTLTEGVIGTPRFINPLLALSDTDRDLTQLLYSGLMRATFEGKLIADLAETYEISGDGLVYTFTLKDELTWHDGKPISSDDVIFTVNKIKDSALRSPKRASWEGVSVQKVDEKTVQFTLLQPYAPFIENTTLGILPKHVWENVTSEQFGFSNLNIEPIGSGPFKIRSIKKDSLGIPEYYDLAPFNNFALGKPYLNNVRIHFYANADEALAMFESRNIEALSTISPARARELETGGRRVVTYTLPRIFGIFFNQNQNPIFTEKAVREALYEAVNRDEIVKTILGGYGTPLYGPLPPGSLGFKRSENVSGANSATLANAEMILEKAGWKKNEKTGIRTKTANKKTQELRFSISTSEAEELKNVVNLLKETWEAIGAQVEIKIFKAGDLNQNVIRPRKYDALFFGEIIGRESDPFAFWHSSQRNDPGLNIALYANISGDKLLEQGRISRNIEERETIYQKFEEEIKKDTPFIPIYSPDFIYMIPPKIRGVSVGTITVPSERFLDIYLWHTEIAKVWRIFK
ncbi:MAG: peptide ABC transporter substrate-binding protein [Parcubacteria group bacterium]|nr:peptide ABC transporter substrate-binding protein [Parcubacteria group bacterium]